MLGIVNQSIAGNPGFRMIRLRYPAVNNKQLSGSLNWAFSLLAFYRHVSIYDMGKLRIFMKFLNDFIHIAFLFNPLIVGIIALSMTFRSFNEAMLKGTHLIFSEKRRLRTAPKIPEKVRGIEFAVRIHFPIHKIGFNTFLFTIVHESLSKNLSVSCENR